MRAAFRQRNGEEEEESVFISMTDMTVSFLFIVMILLAFFATLITPGETVPKEQLDQRDEQIAHLLETLSAYRDNNPSIIPDLRRENDKLNTRIRELEKKLAEIRIALEISPQEDFVKKIAELRDEINLLHNLLKDNPIENYNFKSASKLDELLRNIRARVQRIDSTIEVEISHNQDALQFKGDGLFASGKAEPSEIGTEKMKKIAKVLGEEIGCFTFGNTREIAKECNPDAVAIDAIQIEGHTDSDGGDVFNMKLSSERGAAIYDVMVSERPDLLRFKNIRSQPVLSVAGYGEGRPISDEAEEVGKDANRRIDIRFIMFSPVDQATVPLNVSDLRRVRKILAQRGSK